MSTTQTDSLFQKSLSTVLQSTCFCFQKLNLFHLWSCVKIGIEFLQGLITQSSSKKNNMPLQDHLLSFSKNHFGRKNNKQKLHSNLKAIGTKSMEIKQFTKIECRILCQIIVGHKSRVSKIANYVNKQLKTAYDKTLSLKNQLKTVEVKKCI